ncbi:MAG TPA: hypothetical protein VD963_09600 [Phycisphaerales bacterium]|nr:hypothetical protein [Phycisphaerales bacterium]
MTTFAGTEQLEQVRLRQSVAAAAMERANRPRYLVLAAIGLLLVCSAYTAVQARALADARQQLRVQHDQNRAVVALIDEARRLSQASTTDIHPEDPLAHSALERLARQVGLGEVRVNPQPGRAGGLPGGVSRRDLRTTVASAEPHPILEFLTRAESGEVVPGIVTRTLRLVPVRPVSATDPRPGWRADITFTRLERTK